MPKKARNTAANWEAEHEMQDTQHSSLWTPSNTEMFRTKLVRINTEFTKSTITFTVGTTTQCSGVLLVKQTYTVLVEALQGMAASVLTLRHLLPLVRS